MKPDDPLPALVASIDQLVALAPHAARAARGLFDAFRAEQFSDSQALYLTAASTQDNPLEAP
ncbi:hypothetical protein FSW04_05225 [Baekduia soli]|uniref:Uncharacterized protein n=1 Tax=Baekduia soli TaxID=496014 RepID=A0A5B8U2F7_9ACTN|nr:hypothetical protein [Baekduia soli]QEC47045.1 hypothetical protein FSW04_05225 [Baekduia soli]